MTLLFVCTGNTCRSPLAEAAWHVVSQEASPEWTPATAARITAISAGLAACPGESAARNGLTVARQWGVDMSRHVSKQLTSELVQQADLILTMTSSQADMVQDRFPESRGKVRPLGQYATPEELVRLESLWPGSTAEEQRGHCDIEDPYGGSLADYQECATQILSCVRRLAHELLAEKR